MTKKIKAVIVGYGKMGKIRAETIAKHPGMKLVGICEVAAVGQQLEVPVFKNYKELISFEPDCVFVCTPNKFLSEIACFFINHGVHVFCEKPPGKSVSDVEKMIGAEKNHPEIKLKFGFNHRYHQALMEAKSIVDNGRLGKVLWMRGIYGKGGGPGYDRSWRNNKEISGGGILIDQGIHMVDLFRYFCGEFEEAKSFITKSYWNVSVEDNAFALLKNKQGQVAMLHSSATQWQYKFLLDIYMEKGYISISGILSSTFNYGTETLKIARCMYDAQGYPLPNPEETITYFDEDNSWAAELEDFFQCITEDKEVLVGSSVEAYKTMNLITKVYSADKIWDQPRQIKGALVL